MNVTRLNSEIERNRRLAMSTSDLRLIRSLDDYTEELERRIALLAVVPADTPRTAMRDPSATVGIAHPSR